MRVLRVIASMDPQTGGPCQGIRNTVPEMEKLGVQNEIVCMDSPLSPYLKTDSLTIHALGPAGPLWAYSWRLRPWLIKNLDRFDRVIVHGLWLYPSFALSRIMATGKHSAKWYLMPHGMLDPYFQQAPERRLKALRNRFYWKFIEQKTIAGADAVLFTCAEEMELAKQPFKPYGPRQTLNVGYGIQAPPAFAPEMKLAFQKATGIGQEPYLLFLSRIHPKKGLDMLIEAYSRLIANRETAIPKLVIAGPGMDTAFGKSLLNLVNGSADIKQKIVFPGMLTGDAKWGAFYGCEAFVLPSHQENFGIAVAEALACGKPVIISDKVNIWREIDRERAGIVDADTIDGVFGSLSRYLDLESKEKTKMGQSAETTYKTYFNIHSHVKRLIEAFDN